MKFIILILLSILPSGLSLADNQPYISEVWNPADEFIIQKAIQGQIFYINGKKYKAKRSCKNYEEGQIVQFFGANPNQCFDNTLYNRNTSETCEVFCTSHK